jgi:hypothetical protein
MGRQKSEKIGLGNPYQPVDAVRDEPAFFDPPPDGALGALHELGDLGDGVEFRGSTKPWNDVPRGTMDEVSSYVRLNLPSLLRQGRCEDCSTLSSNPMLEGPLCRVRREARARERHQHCSSG